VSRCRLSSARKDRPGGLQRFKERAIVCRLTRSSVCHAMHRRLAIVWRPIFRVPHASSFAVLPPLRIACISFLLRVCCRTHRHDESAQPAALRIVHNVSIPLRFFCRFVPLLSSPTPPLPYMICRTSLEPSQLQQITLWFGFVDCLFCQATTTCYLSSFGA
jgi:hypothetical protein